VRVTAFQDFGRERILDADGEEIPKQDLYVVTLSNGYRFAARGSGTEPKMKFYLFASDRVAEAVGAPRRQGEGRAELDRLKAIGASSGPIARSVGLSRHQDRRRIRHLLWENVQGSLPVAGEPEGQGRRGVVQGAG
jgi:hypothetical protein